MEVQRDYYTSKEISQMFGVPLRTLQSWRQGYYFKGNQKVWYFSDQSKLDAYWNQPERQLEYSLPRVNIWVARMNNRKHSKKTYDRK